MTTDPFTDAARAEAEVQCGNSFDLEHFMAGAEWARDHLAAQEPTDAECIAVLNAVTTPLGEEPKDGEWFPGAIRRCREAMMSARAARRDEENR